MCIREREREGPEGLVAEERMTRAWPCRDRQLSDYARLEGLRDHIVRGERVTVDGCVCHADFGAGGRSLAV